MGHCSDCGAPCHECMRRSDFTMLRLPQPIREKTRRLLNDVGCRTNKRTNEFITMLVQYTVPEIDRTFRLWNQGGCASSGKDERYFIGILKHNSVGINPVLDSIPPIAPYPKEVDRESKDGDEVSSGVGNQSEDKQELPATDRSVEESRGQDSDSNRSSGT